MVGGERGGSKKGIKHRKRGSRGEGEGGIGVG